MVSEYNMKHVILRTNLDVLLNKQPLKESFVGGRKIPLRPVMMDKDQWH